MKRSVQSLHQSADARHRPALRRARQPSRPSRQRSPSRPPPHQQRSGAFRQGAAIRRHRAAPATHQRPARHGEDLPHPPMQDLIETTRFLQEAPAQRDELVRRYVRAYTCRIKTNNIRIWEETKWLVSLAASSSRRRAPARWLPRRAAWPAFWRPARRPPTHRLQPYTG